MFSHQDILRALDEGDLSVSPWNDRLLQPASLDMRLSHEFLSMTCTNVGVIDPAIDQSKELYTYHEMSEIGWIFIHPGEFLVGSTQEYVKLSTRVGGKVEGKSSLGRLGLLVHATAGVIDPGFEGTITLEIANVAKVPIKLYIGMPVCQLILDDLITVEPEGYSGKYQGQRGPQPSAYWKNFQVGGIMGKSSVCSGKYHVGPWERVKGSDSLSRCLNCWHLSGK